MPPRQRDRLRVLMLIDSLNHARAGAERLLVALAIHLPAERFEVSVCSTRTDEGPLVDELRDAGIHHFSLERSRRIVHQVRFGRLVQYLRRAQIDVLHAHVFSSNVYGTLIGRLAGVPAVIAHEHGWHYQKAPLRRLLDGYFIGRCADAFVVCASETRDNMVRIEGVPRDRTVLIPNFFIPRRTEARQDDLREELGLAPKTPLVGTVASLRPQKALHVLIDAFGLVLREHPDAHLVIAGDGRSRPGLEAQAEQQALRDKVHFLGMREDVPSILQSLDVAAMTSDYEAAPLFALECMAHRAPLVSTNVTGVRELIEDGTSGLLVPPRSPTLVAEAVTTLLRDPDRRAAVADAAYDRLHAHFTVERIVPRYTELYERLVRRRTASAGS